MAFQTNAFQGFQSVAVTVPSGRVGGIPRGFSLFPPGSEAAAQLRRAINEDEWLMDYLKKLVASGQLEQ